MQKIEQDGTTIIIDHEEGIVTVNGRVARFDAEPEKPIHPFLKDVPEEGELAYMLFPGGVTDGEYTADEREISRGTVSLNRDALVELDNRRLALTALKRWIGENDIPVATEEQMADMSVVKHSFDYNHTTDKVELCAWKFTRPIGDIFFLSGSDAKKVRDACDVLIRKAYGWPEVK